MIATTLLISFSECVPKRKTLGLLRTQLITHWLIIGSKLVSAYFVREKYRLCYMWKKEIVPIRSSGGWYLIVSLWISSYMQDTCSRSINHIRFFPWTYSELSTENATWSSYAYVRLLASTWFCCHRVNVFSETHVHVRYMLSPVRLSSVCHLYHSCALLSGLKF